MTVGSILFAFGSPSFDSYIAGYTLIGFGGMSILMAHLRMAEILSKYSGLFISVVSNAFDAAAFVFFIFKLVYDRWQPSIRVLFLAYASVPISLIIFSYLVVPKESEITNRRQTHACLEIQTNFKRQFFNLQFWSMILTISLAVLRQEFYISSYPARIRRLSDDRKSVMNLAVLLFAILFPAAAIVFAPIIGIGLDRLPLEWCFLLANIVGLLFDVLATFPVIWMQYIAPFFLSLWRASTYSFVSTYYMDLFGYRHFGKLYGITFFIAALVNLSQYGLNYAVQKHLQGNIFIIDYALLSVGLLAMVHSSVLFYWRRQQEKTVSQTDENS